MEVSRRSGDKASCPLQYGPHKIAVVRLDTSQQRCAHRPLEASLPTRIIVRKYDLNGRQSHIRRRVKRKRRVMRFAVMSIIHVSRSELSDMTWSDAHYFNS